MISCTDTHSCAFLAGGGLGVGVGVGLPVGFGVGVGVGVGVVVGLSVGVVVGGGVEAAVVLGSGELGLLLGLVGVGLGAEVPLSEGLGVEVAEALWLTVGLTLADDEELVSVALAEGLRLGAVVEVGTMLALAEAEVVPDLLECDVAVALALAGADGALALAGVDVAWPLADVAGELADAWCWLARCFFAGVTTESTRIAALGRLEHAPFTIGGPPTRS